ncbi:retrovirus-related pol polyprotein from transposon TNT 1-94, partial [Tanacetum coccineum]
MPKSSLQLIDEVVDEGVPKKEPAHDDEEANLQRALDLSLKEQEERTPGLARPVVIREPKSGRIQPLPEVQGKEKEKAGPNLGEQDEGQAGSNPGDAAESQPQPSHVVHARPNLEHMDLETIDASTQQKPKQMNKEFTTTAYLNVQENLKLPTEDQVILEEPASSSGTLSSLQNLDKDLSFTNQFFVEKPHEEEPRKTNAESKVQSMVSVPIHQDTSSVPPMTTLVIYLKKSQSDSLLPTSTATTSTITTTTLPPPPPQSTTVLILVRRIGELEQHITDLIQNNLALEERLDKHVSRLYKLENLNILHQVSKVVDEIKSVELDYLNQRLADQEEVRKKKRKRRESPRTPLGSPLIQPPPPPPPAGASGALASTSQSMAWTTSDTQYESADILGAQELSPTDYLMQDDSIPEEQVQLSDDEDSKNDHQ